MFVNASIQEMKTLSQLDQRHTKDELCLSTSATSATIDSFNDGLLLSTYINGAATSPGYTPSIFPWRSEHGHEEPFLLSYYQNVLCATSTLVDDNFSNPLRRLVMPMTAISELVYNATLMVAAHYLQLVAPRYRVTEMSLRQRTLSSLRQAIVSSDWTADDVLLTVMMLCSLDVSSSPVMFPPSQFSPFALTCLDAISTPSSISSKCKSTKLAFTSPSPTIFFLSSPLISFFLDLLPGRPSLAISSHFLPRIPEETRRPNNLEPFDFIYSKIRHKLFLITYCAGQDFV